MSAWALSERFSIAIKTVFMPDERRVDSVAAASVNALWIHLARHWFNGLNVATAMERSYDSGGAFHKN